MRVLLLGVAAFCLIQAPDGRVCAQGVPDALVYTGFLTYAGSGAPYSESIDVELDLFVDEISSTGEVAVWSTDTPISTDVQDGVFSVVLAGGSPVSVTDAVASGARWLQVTIDATPLSPRQEIVSVPFAIRAAMADFADTAASADAVGTIDAADVVTTSSLAEEGFATETYVDSQGFASAAELADYLPRDGSQPMNGDLDLGGSSIANGGSASFSGTVAAAAPVAGNHTTNKAYVDAVVATAASSGGGGGATCYYMKEASSCAPGFIMAPGNFATAAAEHKICCTSTEAATSQSGYFVLTESKYNGDLGGLAGANAECLAELQSKAWLGSGQAMLTSANVRAFLCDSTTCQDPVPGTTYRFAKAGHLEDGGGLFTTDVYGRGPGNTDQWNNSAAFNLEEQYWTGSRRKGINEFWGILLPESNSADASCNDWMDVAPFSGVVGILSAAGVNRWNQTTNSCNGQLRLICLVDPVAE